LRLSPQKRYGRILRIVLTCSWALVSAFALSQSYSALNRRLSSVSSTERAIQIVSEGRVLDPHIETFVVGLRSKSAHRRQTTLNELKDYIGAMAPSEQMLADPEAKSQAMQIKRSPLYRDQNFESSNWFEKAAENFSQFLKNLFHTKPSQDNENVSIFKGALGQALIYLMWAILAGLLCVFGFLGIRQIRWRSSLKRKAKAMLEEDEPERTLDEWLERANALEAQGLYREAVRCLYLACLLRFDEARIARFDRGQTNWEHLERIRSSPKLPPGVDFEPNTEAFDKIWYGMKSKGKSDVETFRSYYMDLTLKLARVAA
jgi:tetratricopeptide (TPR) repeat protein